MTGNDFVCKSELQLRSFFLLRIHVVFGHVLHGQDIVREVENQQVDSKSKPISDVRIANCGELIPKSRLKKGNSFMFFGN